MEAAVGAVVVATVGAALDATVGGAIKACVGGALGGSGTSAGTVMDRTLGSFTISDFS